jgi:hypothetical protein
VLHDLGGRDVARGDARRDLPSRLSCNGNRRETGTATGLSVSDMVDLLSGRAGARRTR